jgi:hypothetical protein
MCALWFGLNTSGAQVLVLFRGCKSDPFYAE